MRYRDLETGTFLTRDPIGYIDGPNRYCYVRCNPIMMFDPFGLKVEDMDEDTQEWWDDHKGDQSYQDLYDYLDDPDDEFYTIRYDMENESWSITLSAKDASGESTDITFWEIHKFQNFESDEYQAHDARFMNTAVDFFRNTDSYTGGQAAGMPGSKLEPDMLKSMALTESGGTAGDPKGQWWTDPMTINGSDPGKYKPDLSPAGDASANIKRATEYLTRKGFGDSGQPIRNRPAGTFDGWKTALEKYNMNKSIKSDGRYHYQHYPEKILERAGNPTKHVPLEIR